MWDRKLERTEKYLKKKKREKPKPIKQTVEKNKRKEKQVND